jgi:NDP-sugar pyrophosphorylase family protein
MNSIRSAIVLAAGKGTRMGGLTTEVPKPMLPVAGKPILEHVLERLQSAGIERVLLVIGYYGDRIREHFADSPLDIHYKEQQVLNGTGSAALLGRDFTPDEPFLLTFGDILCEPADYRGMMALLNDPDTSAVIGVKHVDDPFQGAAVYEEQGRVVRIIEKPPKGTSTTHWNSAGLYVFQPALFDTLATLPLSPRGEYELTTAIVDWLEAGRLIRMYAIQGDWLDVGRPEDLARADQIVKPPYR